MISGRRHAGFRVMLHEIYAFSMSDIGTFPMPVDGFQATSGDTRAVATQTVNSFCPSTKGAMISFSHPPLASVCSRLVTGCRSGGENRWDSARFTVCNPLFDILLTRVLPIQAAFRRRKSFL